MNTKSHFYLKKQLKVLGFKGCNKREQQLFLRIGMTPGALFTLLRKAPFGDLIEIYIRDTRIALSKTILEKLQIEAVL